MDALKIALETIIVGTLGLPWMFLLVDLFCPEREALLKSLLARLGDKATSTIAGVLLFALAYLVGASVARVADDFFNDDDLRTGVTEDTIRADVYCAPVEAGDQRLVQNGAVLIDKNGGRIESQALCSGDRDTLINHARQTYSVQEASLLLTSAGNTDRIRYLHQQHVVLRGVAFDGLIVTLLCLFGVCSEHRPWGQRILVGLSLVIFAWAVYAGFRHLSQHWGHMPGAPPLMEGMLIALAVAGLCIAWRDVPQRSYKCGFMFSAVLTALALSGWWYSEIVYDRTIIYFFYAHTHASTLLR